MVYEYFPFFVMESLAKSGVQLKDKFRKCSYFFFCTYWFHFFSSDF